MKKRELQIIFNDICSRLAEIRKNHPLVLNLTNSVTMEFVANALLSVGASPIMSFSQKEMKELVHSCHAIVINIGTFDESFIHLVHSLQRHNKKYKRPIILDPVGTGFTKERTNLCQKILNDGGVHVVRGNYSEVKSLLKMSESKMNGVDSKESLTVEEIEYKKKNKAEIDGPVFCATGKTDFIFSMNENQNIVKSQNWGDPMMSQVTGMGCSLSAVVAAFYDSENPLESTSLATSYYTLCGSLAGKKVDELQLGPGSFKTIFLDMLYSFERNEKEFSFLYES